MRTARREREPTGGVPDFSSCNVGCGMHWALDGHKLLTDFKVSFAQSMTKKQLVPVVAAASEGSSSPAKAAAVPCKVKTVWH